MKPKTQKLVVCGASNGFSLLCFILGAATRGAIATFRLLTKLNMFRGPIPTAILD